LEALGINLGYLIVQIFNFLVVAFILSRFVFKPILNMLAQRKETVEQGLEDARVAGEAKAQAEEQAAKIIAEARQQSREELRQAAEKAESLTHEVKAEAEQDIVKLREAAKAEAEQMRNELLGEMRGQVAALAIAAAQKVIGETLDEKRQRALIDSFFSGIEGKKVALLEDMEIEGASAEVVSALPLTDKEQGIIQERLLKELDPDTEVAFVVNPSILGGLVIRVNDKVMDGSVAGRLNQLEQHLA